MKKVYSSVLLLFLAMFVQAQGKKGVHLFSYFKGNGEDGLHLAYSTDGLKWQSLYRDSSLLRPAVGGDKLMRDPCIIRGRKGVYHMVWTVSWKERGIGYASSKDLVNWTEQKFIPVMEHEPTARNTWAPEITLDRKNRRYVIYWATTIPGRFAAGESTAESGYNHRMYYVTTKDFQTFSPARLLYDKGFNVIDATIVPDGDRFVMFLKDETSTPPQKNIRVAFSDSATGGFSTPSGPITGKYWAEGPTVLRMGNDWIVYFDKYTEHKYGAVRSSDLKTWTDISDQVLFPKGTRHGTVFTVSKREFRKLQKKLARKEKESAAK